MAKFAYITDTHLGAGEGAWGQQPTYPQLVPQLFDDLNRYLDKHPVDFILHGGDVIDDGSQKHRQQLSEIISQLSFRFYLTLGNHDLASPDALEQWHKHSELFFADNVTKTCDFAVNLDGGAKLIVMTNTWQPPFCDEAFYWNKDGGAEQLAGFTELQYDWLESQLADNKPTILSIHETLYPLHTELTGMDEPIHNPPGEYAQKIREFVESRPQIKLVLSGHCHASCRTKQDSTVHLTTAAYFEPPFQIRIIEVDEKSIDVSVAYPVDLKKYPVELNKERMWSAGKWYDWRISIGI